jgi:hypothetical protein
VALGAAALSSPQRHRRLADGDVWRLGAAKTGLVARAWILRYFDRKIVILAGVVEMVPVRSDISTVGGPGSVLAAVVNTL